jgi:phenylalanyl-tRNA synthetase alpha chain
MESKNVLIDELKNLLKNAKNETQAIEIKNIFNKTKLNPLYAKLKEKADKEKNIFGKLINEIKIESNEIIEQKINYFKSLEEKNNHIVNYDISINTTNLEKGALNPISLVIQDILGYFESLNFTIQSGEEVMSIKYNFDNLNIPLTHPTREASETFYTDDGWSLRTQNTASSAQFMDNNQDEEIKVANFGYVYRNDEDDATHSHQFNQVDFI